MSRVHLITILLICTIQTVCSYPNSAPESACPTLDPSGHGPSTATGPSPYNLSLSATSYKPGDVITVTLGGALFKGFLLVARRTNGQADAIGNISVETNSMSQCSGPLGNGVCHNNNTVKSSISFKWTAPAASEGDVVFHYTVVRGGAPNTARDAADYYKDLTSATIKAEVLSSFKKNPECGTTRGCFSNCVNDVCDWELSWKNAGDGYQITIKSIAEDNTYFSLGFSNTSAMDPASVVSCVVSQGLVSVNASLNVGHRNVALANPTEGISNETNSFNNGLLECSFFRDALSSDPQVYNLTEPWYLIAAKGNVSAAGSLNRHSRQDRFSTTTRINLSNLTTDYTTVVTTTAAPASSTPTPSGQFKKNPECGISRGCYSDCVNDACNWELSWKNAGAKYDITIKSSAADNTYISLGFSDSNGMNPASVVSCVVSQGIVSVKASVNQGYGNLALANPKEGISNETNSYNNGLLQCSFSRDTLSSDPQVYNLTEPWYLITAKGSVSAAGDLLQHSAADRFFTNSPVNLTTDQTIDVIPTPTPASQSTTPSSQSSFKRNPECGTIRGCYSDCVNDACTWELSWKNAGAKYDITIKSSAADNTYISLGFSDSNGMTPASVVSCVVSQGLANVKASFNPGYSNQALANPKEGISSEANSYNNGLLQCSFSRDTLSSDPQVYNLTESWYLITAKGNVNAAGDIMRHSATDRFFTNARVNLTTDQTIDVIPTPPSSSTTPSSPVSKFQKDPECGKTKGCFSNCKDNLCDLLVSWEYKGSYYIISLKSGVAALGDYYFAFGLSDAAEMGPASVIACTSSQAKVDAYASFNDASHGNSQLPNNKDGLSNITGSFSEGVVSCTLYRETTSSNGQIYDLKQTWYIVTARGIAGQGGSLRPHAAADTSVWTSRVDFTDPTIDISMEGQEYPLVKAHGCLMVITWVLAASIGLTMARFSKKLWPDSKVCGVKIWFAVHRAAMVVAFLLGITAFILIFIQVKGYSETNGPAYMKAHPVLGIMVTALLFINPFMSLLRCAPDHPRRELFNWAHWLVGTSAHVLGGITIVLGLYMPKALLDADKGLIIMIVYGSWYIIFFLIMTQLDIKSSVAPSKTTTTGVNPLELTDVAADSIGKGSGDVSGSFGPNEVVELTSVKYGLLNGSNEPPLSGVKKLLTCFHFLMLIAITISLIYLIVNGSI